MSVAAPNHYTDRGQLPRHSLTLRPGKRGGRYLRAGGRYVFWVLLIAALFTATTSAQSDPSGSQDDPPPPMSPQDTDPSGASCAPVGQVMTQTQPFGATTRKLQCVCALVCPPGYACPRQAMQIWQCSY
jgi:hypothetical protein